MNTEPWGWKYIAKTPKAAAGIKYEIKNLNILEMTPIDALNTLYKLKEEVDKK